MGLRVRWQLAAKGAAVVVAVLLALQLVPSLLKPPAPEPLPADVGLPQVVSVAPQVPIAGERPQASRRKLAQSQRRLGRVVSGGGVSLRAEPSEGEASPRRGHRPFARRR